MKRISLVGYSALIVAAFHLSLAVQASEPKPLTHAHAHNDYNHKRPLLDALDHGFCSVEADVHLVDGQLLVAHDRISVKSGRTLQTLYLDPLRERVKTNSGRVYPGGPEFTLLIDLKGDWKTSYPVLRNILKQYSEMLVTFQDGKKITNAIQVIVTGDRSRKMFTAEVIRYASLDGDIPDLSSSDPANLIPWISANWRDNFKWRGTGEMPDEDKARLKDMVQRAHQQGRQVRFWGAPDKPAFWTEMRTIGVDLLNIDSLDAGQQFLLNERP